MTKKITISVPDELHEKMEGWKDSFNFSGVFQEAIREKIQRKEDFQQRIEEGGFDMEAAIERLRSEKAELDNFMLEHGKKDGLEWAKFSHYVDIQNALKWDPEMGALPKDDDLSDQIKEIVAEDPQLGYREDSWRLDECTTEWAKGWVEGVQAFWDEVKNKI